MKRSQNFKLGIEIQVLGINKYGNKESAGGLIAILL
jgi:hypothetical protein